MKASVANPRSLQSELIRGVAAIAVGAALTYAAAHLFAWSRLAPQPAVSDALATQPQPHLARKPVAIEPPPPGEDPWWRGDAAFWQEQARLNSAIVAPQYRELQFAWAEQMAASAKQRALQGATGSEPLAMPAKEAQTTELQVPVAPRR